MEKVSRLAKEAVGENSWRNNIRQGVSSHYFLSVVSRAELVKIIIANGRTAGIRPLHLLQLNFQTESKTEIFALVWTDA